jgi:hypothetical protein
MQSNNRPKCDIYSIKTVVIDAGTWRARSRALGKVAKEKDITLKLL